MEKVFNETFEVSKKVFKNQLIKLLGEYKTINSRNLFVNLHLAYHCASGRELVNNSIILYHIHAVKKVSALTFCLDDFQFNDVKLIFVTKHPLEGLRSIVNWSKNVSIPVIDRSKTLYYYQHEVYNGINRVSEANPNLDIKIVMLNQMINDREILLRRFTSWLNIDWKDYLETNDWKIMSAIFPKRIDSYGLIPHDSSTKSSNLINKSINNIRLSLLSLLPMHCEWFLLKSIINQRSFKRIFRDIQHSLENTSTEPDIDVSLIRKVFVKATSIILFCITFFNFILQFFKYYIIRISLSITLIGDKAYPDTEGLKRLLTTD